MKKCKKCGAVQSDDRTTCVDCGTLLGRPMTEAEEAHAEAALDDKLDGLAERAQDFYVSVPEKVMGILCIIAAAAAIVMLGLISAEKPTLDELIPEHIKVFRHAGGTTYAHGFDPVTGENYEEEIPQYYFIRGEELEKAGLAALYAMVFCAVAAPSLLVPRLIWWLDTLKYRLWYDWQPSPPWFVVSGRKVTAYFISAAGMIGVIYSYFLYFG